VKGLQRHYDLAVLWLLSICAQGVMERIYAHGHEDGANELRDYMRRELEAVHVAAVVDRMRYYTRGYRDGLGELDAEDPDAAAPIERVM
jgi:hypothetical protein